MSVHPYTDAELEAGARALPVAHGCEDPDWLAVARADAAVVLGAVLPAHAARIRRETAEAIATYFDGWSTVAGAVHADAMVESWQEAARLARDVGRNGGAP